VFAVDRAGLVGEDGETHHGVFDIAYLGHIPNFRILAPSSYLELREMLRYAMHELDCPVAVRYSRGSEGAYKGNSFVNRESSALLKHGMDITLISYGIMINEVIEAAELSGKDGISCEIIKLNSLNPLDISQIRDSVRKTRRLIVVEDCVKAGSIGEKISARLFEDGIACKVKLLNTGDGFTPGGEQPRLYSLLGIDSYGIYGSIAKELKD
jgi:1-deoxy-D-xylulose-5-phosphate synthase